MNVLKMHNLQTSKSFIKSLNCIQIVEDGVSCAMGKCKSWQRAFSLSRNVAAPVASYDWTCWLCQCGV